MSTGSTGPVFVAGATGYTGREVVRECRARGLETFAHVRPDSRDLERWRERFEALGARVDTTAWERTAMTSRLAALQPMQVYALLGTTRARGKAGTGSAVADTYEAVDYGLSILLLEAAIACGSKPRFVYLSAMGAGGRPVNAYMDVRKRVEAAVRESELPYLLARPGFITGDDRDEWRAGERIAATISNGALALVGALGGKRIATRYTSITGGELARAMVELACASASACEIAEVEDLKRAIAGG
jgi:uncharacterized protein YbjT (DUF2867 family)